MANYANGQVPPSLLRPVNNFRPLTANVNAGAGSNLLREDAFLALCGLQAAFFARFKRTLNISEAYRKRELQDYYWDLYIRGIGNQAAFPGTSNHGWAISCDFGSGAATYGSEAKVWLDANAPAYGWKPTGNGFAKREAWHFDFFPGTATALIPAAGDVSPFPTDPSSPPVIAPPEEEEEEDMGRKLAIWQGANTGDRRTLLVDLNYFKPFRGVEIDIHETSILRSSKVPFVSSINQAVFDSVTGLPATETVIVEGYDANEPVRIRNSLAALEQGQNDDLLVIVFKDVEGNGTPYLYNGETGTKRALSGHELGVLRYAKRLPEMGVTQDALDSFKTIV